MRIRLKNDLAKKIGEKTLEDLGLRRIYLGNNESVDINLATLSAKKLDKVQALIEQHATGKTKTLLLQDIGIWRTALSQDPAELKTRTVEGLKGLLDRYLLQFPGHRVMQEQKGEGWLSSYVNRIEYHPPRDRGDNHVPARVTMQLMHAEYGTVESETISFDADNIRGKTVAVVLADKGIYPETAERRATYLQELAKWEAITKNIGGQYLATGTGDCSPDGNPKREDHQRFDRWFYVALTQDGEPTRVVSDVFSEAAEASGGGRRRRGSEEGSSIEQTYWQNVAAGVPDDDDDDGPDELPGVISDEPIEIPIHPFLVVFHLKKHLRLRVHVDQLTDYKYDTHLADKLVLSQERKTLVQMLIDMKRGMFRDIVQGKGGGATILLAGPPGTGKTLTAEVYAESEKKPLYSVQCSQLGTDPDNLEEELLKVFARGRRWGAVMLLDEADVYVHERGNDMQRNAVVGVFLRVLEYQDSVLFLTTNRPDDVDDAIASRCIAKLTYQVPTPDEQARIWHVLADASDIKITPATIQAIVKKNPELSGRDVKNLLKLASLIGGGTKEVTADGVAFVQQFKPTGRTA